MPDEEDAGAGEPSPARGLATPNLDGGGGVARRFSGQRLRAFRRMKGWTQRRLGERLDADQRTIIRWENGATKQPDPEHLAMLAHVLGIEAIDLFEETPDEDEEEVA